MHGTQRCAFFRTSASGFAAIEIIVFNPSNGGVHAYKVWPASFFFDPSLAKQPILAREPWRGQMHGFFVLTVFRDASDVASH